ncbi:MAG: Lrp/AsnC family transcriptional regulator [Methanobacteriota archaeon]
MRRLSMTMTCFILVKTDPGSEYAVFKALDGIPQIKEKHGLFGEYDVIAKVQVKTEDELTHLVTDQIRRVKGVAETKTFIGTKL